MVQIKQEAHRKFPLTQKYDIDLKLAMLKAGLTQRDVAEKTGIHETTISGIIRGRIVPSEQERKYINKALFKV